MASTVARAPLAAVSDNKESNAEDSEKSPYKQRMKELEECRMMASDNKVLMFLGEDILECIPGKLDQLEVEEVDQLEDKDAAYDSITQQEVDKYLQVMIVDRKLCELQDKYYKKIMFADPRNDEGDGILMLNTHSSWCMYPVIQKLLTAATKEINKAKKAVEGGASSKNVAADAFNVAFASVLACHAMDHWRLDTESPEDCEKVAKKVSKICSDLLWFHDQELGFVDSYSRKSLITKLQSVHEDWSDIGGVKFKNAKNGQGLGRSRDTSPPPAKKLKTTGAAVTSTTSTSSSGTNNLAAFLNAIQAKKKLREKTCVQLKIASVDKPDKSALVVVSGATDMKKFNQLCAYVTGHSQGFEYHSQRGTCINGSRIELHLEGSKLWLAPKAMAKQAGEAAHVEDKQVKIIQVFQGLNTSPTSGLVYDSDHARNVQAYWVTPAGERYQISVQAIIANKCISGKALPMPRLVKHLEDHTPNPRTGFGKGLYVANRHMQGDRQGPKYLVLRGTSKAEMQKIHDRCASAPIANEDGTVDCKYAQLYWKPENVATAGPPNA